MKKYWKLRNGNPVYSGMSNTWLEKFESLLLRAKLVVNCGKKWPTFQIRLQRKIALDVFKAVNVDDSKYNFIEHGKNTRGNRCLLRLTKIQTETGRKTSYYQGASIFNSLDVNIRQQKNQVLFKNLIKEFNFKI